MSLTTAEARQMLEEGRQHLIQAAQRFEQLRSMAPNTPPYDSDRAAAIHALHTLAPLQLWLRER